MFYLRRRGQESADSWSSSYEPASTPPAPDVVEAPGAELPVDPDAPGTAPDPEAREMESDVTDETRYDRLVEHEREERREAAERVLEDPLTERLEDDAEPRS